MLDQDESATATVDENDIESAVDEEVEETVEVEVETEADGDEQSSSESDNEADGEANSEPTPSTPPVPESTPTVDVNGEFIGSLREREMLAWKQEMKINDLKEELKHAKDRLEEIISGLRSMVRNGPNRQQTLPFGTDLDGKKEESAEAVNSESTDDDDADDDTEPTEPNSNDKKPSLRVVHADDDEWKGTPLTELSLSSKILDALGEARLTTLGELSEWTAKNFNKLTDLKGIGPAKAEQIEQACEKFWAERTTASTA